MKKIESQIIAFTYEITRNHWKSEIICYLTLRVNIPSMEGSDEYGILYIINQTYKYLPISCDFWKQIFLEKFHNYKYFI